MPEICATDATKKLEESLRMLGLRELEERLEVSPLAFGSVQANGHDADAMFQSCQHCRLITTDDGPVPTSTGPTNPGGDR